MRLPCVRFTVQRLLVAVAALLFAAAQIHRCQVAAVSYRRRAAAHGRKHDSAKRNIQRTTFVIASIWSG